MNFHSFQTPISYVFLSFASPGSDVYNLRAQTPNQNATPATYAKAINKGSMRLYRLAALTS